MGMNVHITRGVGKPDLLLYIKASVWAPKLAMGKREHDYIRKGSRRKPCSIIDTYFNYAVQLQRPTTVTVR